MRASMDCTVPKSCNERFLQGVSSHLNLAVMEGTLLSGKHEEIPEVLMFRNETPFINYLRQVRQDNRGAVNRLFLLMPMTKDLLLRQRILLDLNITLTRLLRLSCESFYARPHQL
jgi:hypothetical protein